VSDTTSACCGKTVVVVRNMDTGVKTAVRTEFDMERTGVASEKERIALQAQMVAHLTPKHLCFRRGSFENPLCEVLPGRAKRVSVGDPLEIPCARCSALRLRFAPTQQL